MNFDVNAARKQARLYKKAAREIEKALRLQTEMYRAMQEHDDTLREIMGDGGSPTKAKVPYRPAAVNEVW